MGLMFGWLYHLENILIYIYFENEFLNIEFWTYMDPLLDSVTY